VHKQKPSPSGRGQGEGRPKRIPNAPERVATALTPALSRREREKGAGEPTLLFVAILLIIQEKNRR
jgi:hypothetical protein